MIDHLTKKIYFISCLLLLQIISFASLFSQSKKIVFEHITINQGLSQGTVTKILQDKEGFMWFSTHDGLNKYDGYNFTIYKNHELNPNSISGNWINDFDEDKNGDLWIATSNGFSKYIKSLDKFEQYFVELKNHMPRLEGKFIYSIFCDRINDNIVWLGTIYGLIQFDKLSREFLLVEYPDDIKITEYVKSIYQDKSGKIWFGTNSQGVFQFDPARQAIKYYSLDVGNPKDEALNFFNSFYEDSKGKLWLGCRGGLYNYDYNDEKFERLNTIFGDANPITNAVTMTEDADKKFYVGTSDGLYIIDNQLNLVSHFAHSFEDPTSLNFSSVLSLFVDQSNIVWIGSNGMGLSRINPFFNRFKRYSHKGSKIGIGSVRTFCEDSEKNIWIGGYEGVFRLDRKTNEIESVIKKSDKRFSGVNATTYIMVIDKENPDKFIWLGSEGNGVVRFNFTNNTWEKIPADGNSEYAITGIYVYSLFDDGAGNLWIGTDRGLNKYNKSTKKNIFYEHNENDPNSIGPKRITTIYQDHLGRLWIGTDLGGVNYFDKSKGKFTRYLADPNNPKSISSNSIKSIYEDEKKNLWIGTLNGGLNKLNRETGTFEIFSVAGGLPNEVVYGILEDNSGNLWLSTNAGLSKFNYETKSFFNFSTEDGLQSNEFNTNAYFKSRDGELFFGGVGGFNSFYPDEIVENKNKPKVVLTKFYLNNQLVPVGITLNNRIILNKAASQVDTIELSYTDKVLSFEFAALDFTFSHQNTYAYKLEGFNKEWIRSGSSRFAHFTNLDPGEYLLYIRGSNNDGVWNQIAKPVLIIITPPFWLTWWFRIMSIVVLMLFVYFVYEYRVFTIKKRSRELENEVRLRTEELRLANNKLQEDATSLELSNTAKDKFFSIISHDLKSPFQALLGFTEWLSDDYNNLSEQDRKNIITDIKISSQNIYTLLIRLLEWSRLQSRKVKPEPVILNLRKSAGGIIAILHVNAVKKNIKVTNDLAENINVFADENMFNSTLQNLLSNAIKFTQDGGRITISSSIENGFAQIAVSDSGIGMDNDTIEKLFELGKNVSTKGTNDELGTGFGLLLCKEMVELNGGIIWVESEEGQGSTFFFTVPLYNKQGVPFKLFKTQV